MKNLLPIGSVITLKGATKKIMLIGIMAGNQEDGKTFDYLGLPFPEGFVDNDTMFLFNHEDIVEVNFLGFINAEAQAFRAQIQTMLSSAEQSEGMEEESASPTQE